MAKRKASISVIESSDCPYYGRHVPDGWAGCETCEVVQACYAAWEQKYTQAVEGCLSGTISYDTANQRLAGLGCKVPTGERNGTS
jgi:hypothetical protein